MTLGLWDPRGGAKIQGLFCPSKTPLTALLYPQPPVLDTAAAHVITQGACDFIPFGAEPGIKPNMPSYQKQLFDIFNDFSPGRQWPVRVKYHR